MYIYQITTTNISQLNAEGTMSDMHSPSWGRLMVSQAHNITWPLDKVNVKVNSSHK